MKLEGKMFPTRNGKNHRYFLVVSKKIGRENAIFSQHHFLHWMSTVSWAQNERLIKNHISLFYRGEENYLGTLSATQERKEETLKEKGAEMPHIFCHEKNFEMCREFHETANKVG